MLSKLDGYKILLEMKLNGVDVDDPLKQLAGQTYTPSTVIKFINKFRELSVTKFYEDLRIKNNKKESRLYKNLMQEELESLDCIKAISSFITQAVIMGETLNLNERLTFFKAVRLTECSKALNKYFATNELDDLKTIRGLIKSDIKIFLERENLK